MQRYSKRIFIYLDVIILSTRWMGKIGCVKLEFIKLIRIVYFPIEADRIVHMLKNDDDDNDDDNDDDDDDGIFVAALLGFNSNRSRWSVKQTRNNTSPSRQVVKHFWIHLVVRSLESSIMLNCIHRPHHRYHPVMR